MARHTYQLTEEDNEIKTYAGGRDMTCSSVENNNLEHSGDFIPTIFCWVTTREQRKRAKEISRGLE